MDSRAQAWDERYAASELVWSRGPNIFVEQELTGRSPGRALDLACGEGRNALWLAGLGWTVTAMDFSRVAVERGAELDESGSVTWMVGDVVSADLPEDLDLALLAYLQVPAEDRGAAVRRAFDALASGGRLLVVAHDSTNLTEGTGGPQDPAVLYTAEDVLADLGDRGYEVVRAERLDRTVPQLDGHSGTAGATAYDAVVHLVRT